MFTRAEAVYLLCHPKLRELLSEADPRWYSAAARLQLTSLLKEIKASMQHAPVPDARPLLTWLATFGKLLLFYHQHAHFQPALLRRCVRRSSARVMFEFCTLNVLLCAGRPC